MRQNLPCKQIKSQILNPMEESFVLNGDGSVTINSVLDTDGKVVAKLQTAEDTSTSPATMKEIYATPNGVVDVLITHKSLQLIWLPETGGIGTTIFFIVGGAIVVMATVLIVTRFRVKRERL